MTTSAKDTAIKLRRAEGEDMRSLAGAALAHRKVQKVGRRAIRIQCAQAAKSHWDRMTPEQRSREMRRRRRLGHLRKKQRALGIAS